MYTIVRHADAMRHAANRTDFLSQSTNEYVGSLGGCQARHENMFTGNFP